jgi:hypothetical protein
VTFENFSRREGPARTATTLILNGRDNTFVSPVNFVGKLNVRVGESLRDGVEAVLESLSERASHSFLKTHTGSLNLINSHIGEFIDTHFVGRAREIVFNNLSEIGEESRAAGQEFTFTSLVVLLEVVDELFEGVSIKLVPFRSTSGESDDNCDNNYESHCVCIF